MPATAPLTSLSGLYAWPTDHLSEAATYWTNTAESWESAFNRISDHISTPGGTPGQARPPKQRGPVPTETR